MHFTSDTPLFTDNSATQQAATAKAGTEALVTGDTTNGCYEVKGSVAEDGTFTDGKDGTAYYMTIPADAASATFVPDADYENAWTFDGTYTDADCDDKGSFEETNSITGETRENDIDKAAHFEGEMKTTKKPGLFTAGKREAKCLICGDTVESEKIPSKFASWWKGIFSSKADKKKTADEKKELDEKNEERKGEKDGLKDTVKTALSSAALSDADTNAFSDAVEKTDEVKDLVSLNAAIAEKAGNSQALASAQAAAGEFIAGRSTARAEAAEAERQALLAAQAAAESNGTESAKAGTDGASGKKSGGSRKSAGGSTAGSGAGRSSGSGAGSSSGSGAIDDDVEYAKAFTDSLNRYYDSLTPEEKQAIEDEKAKSRQKLSYDEVRRQHIGQLPSDWTDEQKEADFERWVQEGYAATGELPYRTD